MAEEAAVQNAPSVDSALQTFAVHAGAKMRIDGQSDEWVATVLEDGKVQKVGIAPQQSERNTAEANAGQDERAIHEHAREKHARQPEKTHASQQVAHSIFRPGLLEQVVQLCAERTQLGDQGVFIAGDEEGTLLYDSVRYAKARTRRPPHKHRSF